MSSMVSSPPTSVPARSDLGSFDRADDAFGPESIPRRDLSTIRPMTTGLSDDTKRALNPPGREDRIEFAQSAVARGADQTPPDEPPRADGGRAAQTEDEAAARGPREAGKHSSTRSEQPTAELSNRHLFAVHTKARPSCLTAGAPYRPSFGGFRNLMILMLVVSNLRLMIENFRKYGVLICLQCHDISQTDLVYGLVLYLSVPCQLLIGYLIEKFAAWRAGRVRERIVNAIAAGKKDDDINSAETDRRVRDIHWQRQFRHTWYFVGWAHMFNATFNLVLASWVVYNHIHHPLIGTMCELHAIIVWLKSCSYAFTNRDLRHLYLAEAVESDDQEKANRIREMVPEIYRTCQYPTNITVGNLVYFWWAPTLVYQPVYLRTEEIRWTFVAKRIGEMVGLGIVIWIATVQYAAPLLRNSLATIETLDIVSICERVLKLSTISLFVWLAGFFAFFQSFLNALAELVRFADRDFYADWWNAPSIRVYWTNWNRPVSRLMRRHIYSPLVARGMKPAVAQVLVFVVSGVLHELLVGIPTHNLLGVACLGMVFQIPLIFITDLLHLNSRKSRASPECDQPLEPTSILGKKPDDDVAVDAMPAPSTLAPTLVPQERQSSTIDPEGRASAMIGNMLFWVSFCLVGQPLAALLYFCAWENKYGSMVRQQAMASAGLSS